MPHMRKRPSLPNQASPRASEAINTDHYSDKVPFGPDRLKPTPMSGDTRSRRPLGRGR